MAQTAEGNRLTPEERQRMCGSKKRLRKEGEAIAFAIRGEQRDGRKRRVYRCPVCVGYHVTTEVQLPRAA